jgi:hypothetical protein
LGAAGNGSAFLLKRRSFFNQLRSSPVYCYLQIELHNFRIFLLVPFVASHFLVLFSLHHPYNGNFVCIKNNPSRFSINHNQVMQTLHTAKVKHTAKQTTTGSSTKGCNVLNSIFCISEPVRLVAGYRCSMSGQTLEFNPSTLLPSRASPA